MVLSSWLFFPDATENFWDRLKSGFKKNSDSNNKETPVFNETPNPGNDTEAGVSEKLLVANWHINEFTRRQAVDFDGLRYYSSIMSDYDLVFVQGINDRSGIAFDYLCSYMPDDYECSFSYESQTGSQQGVFYKDSVELRDWKVYTGSEDVWVNTLARASFVWNGVSFKVFNVVIDEDKARQEIKALSDIASSEQGNVLVLGDLKADCGYYSQVFGGDFIGWNWVIENDARTNVLGSRCAYDRILFNNEFYEYYEESGVRDENVTSNRAANYVVWTSIKSR